jgi:HAD superfamily hydrolase (TIGR01509 family)
MIKAAIFDMDGIIIDSEPLQMVAINQVMAQWDIQLSEEDFLPMIGRRLSDDFVDLKKKFPVPVEYPEFAKMKNQAYQNLIQHSIQEMPGLSRLLKELKKANILLAVASGSGRWDIDLVLEGLGLSSAFDVITSGNEVTHGKPHPEIYILTANRLQIAPEFCVAFEDTSYGVTSAKSAGMKCVAVPHKYTVTHDFREADMVADSLQKLTVSLLQEL